MTIWKENHICIFIFSDAVFSMRGGFCRHLHGKLALNRVNLYVKEESKGQLLDLEGRD